MTGGNVCGRIEETSCRDNIKNYFIILYHDNGNVLIDNHRRAVECCREKGKSFFCFKDNINISRFSKEKRNNLYCSIFSSFFCIHTNIMFWKRREKENIKYRKKDIKQI